ncbi:MAG: hypothetical protein WKF71_11295 [Pyrinomonadaceae bacterium]
MRLTISRFEVARDEPKNSYAFAVLGMTLLSAGNFRGCESLSYQRHQTQQFRSPGLVGLGYGGFL